MDKILHSYWLYFPGGYLILTFGFVVFIASILGATDVLKQRSIPPRKKTTLFPVTNYLQNPTLLYYTLAQYNYFHCQNLERNSERKFCLLNAERPSIVVMGRQLLIFCHKRDLFLV